MDDSACSATDQISSVKERGPLLWRLGTLGEKECVDDEISAKTEFINCAGLKLVTLLQNYSTSALSSIPYVVLY